MCLIWMLCKKNIFLKKRWIAVNKCYSSKKKNHFSFCLSNCGTFGSIQEHSLLWLDRLLAKWASSESFNCSCIDHNNAKDRYLFKVAEHFDVKRHHRLLKREKKDNDQNHHHQEQSATAAMHFAAVSTVCTDRLELLFASSVFIRHRRQNLLKYTIQDSEQNTTIRQQKMKCKANRKRTGNRNETPWDMFCTTISRQTELD